MIKRVLIFIYLVMLISLSFTSATTYYVSTTGSDTNPGTEAQPWLTIQKAANVAIAGDNVIVGNGTYAEMIETKRAGTQTSPITFMGSGQTTIQSFGIFHEWNNVDNFRITASNAPIYAAITFTKSNIRITRNVIHNIHRSAIRTVDSSGSPVGVASWPSNIYIGNNTFSGVDTVSVVIVVAINSSIIENNIFDSNAADTIDLWGSDNTFRKNTVTNTLRDIIGLARGEENHNDFIQTWYVGPGSYSKNNIIEGNLIKDNYIQLYNLEDGNYQTDYCCWTFRNNVFINNYYNGNAGITYTNWYSNTFYRSPYYPGFVSIAFFNQDKFHSFGGIIKNNLFVNGGFNSTEGLKLASYSVGYAADYNLVIGMPPHFDQIYQSPTFSEAHGLNGIDPMFVDAENGDVRLKEGSPAIGAGIALNSEFTTDFDGVTRGTTWDMGAYEYISSETVNNGDINNDGSVNVLDIILIVNDYGKSSEFNTRADLIKDNFIDLNDIIELTRYWGRTY